MSYNRKDISSYICSLFQAVRQLVILRAASHQYLEEYHHSISGNYSIAHYYTPLFIIPLPHFFIYRLQNNSYSFDLKSRKVNVLIIATAIGNTTFPIISCIISLIQPQSTAYAGIIKIRKIAAIIPKTLK